MQYPPLFWRGVFLKKGKKFVFVKKMVCYLDYILFFQMHKLYRTEKPSLRAEKQKGTENQKMKKGIKSILAAITVLAVVAAVVLPVGVLAKESELCLIPGGMAFGVKFFASGALVVGTAGVSTEQGLVFPAKDAGLKQKDVIIRVGGREFKNAEELISTVAGSGGKPISIAFLRNGEEMSVTVTPKKDLETGEYRMGVLVRDSTAGIGTVTYIVPATKEFGGLGHGICESETGALFPLSRGAVVDVAITDVVKSQKNQPGELRGAFGKEAVGELFSNTDAGVFGRYVYLPKNLPDPIPVGSKKTVTEGRATVLTTLSGEGVKEYEILLERIYDGSGDTKNFLIRVTDPALLEKTGGIVQGMSGSPIIQDGKLVGAVTHVLVNDPTRGYGIFIENMLNNSYEACEINEILPLAA